LTSATRVTDIPSVTNTHKASARRTGCRGPRGPAVPLCALAALLVDVSAADNTLCFSLDGQLSLRAGMEHRYSERLGLKYDLGVGATGTVVADAFMVVYLLPDTSRWELDLCLGMPNAGVPIGAGAGMVSLGLSLLVRRELGERMAIDLRLGEGFPLFFESGTDVVRDISFPLELWPDVTLGLSVRL
jgi:hypothetical protein